MKFLYSAQSISLNYDGNTKIIDKNDARYGAVLEALKNKAFDKVKAIVDGLKNVLNTSTSSAFKVENGLVYIDNIPVRGVISDRIISYVNAGLDPAALVNFWRNLQKNPSSRARERLYLFLENGNHPFTDDGCFIAYKKVNGNMTDNRTGKIDNSVGKKPSMPRSEVDDDPEHTCSSGLHVASWEYAQGYAGTVLIDVKVNPVNVVSIPTDYNNQKMRVCEYEVIAISQGKREELHVSDNLPDLDDEDFEDEDFEDEDLDVEDLDIDPKATFGNDPDYAKGKSDAEALWIYFESIGNKYTSKDFLKLKRFEAKSEAYKAGVAAAVEVLDPNFD